MPELDGLSVFCDIRNSLAVWWIRKRVECWMNTKSPHQFRICRSKCFTSGATKGLETLLLLPLLPRLLLPYVDGQIHISRMDRCRVACNNAVIWMSDILTAMLVHNSSCPLFLAEIGYISSQQSRVYEKCSEHTCWFMYRGENFCKEDRVEEVFRYARSRVRLRWIGRNRSVLGQSARLARRSCSKHRISASS